MVRLNAYRCTDRNGDAEAEVKNEDKITGRNGQNTHMSAAPWKHMPHSFGDIDGAFGSRTSTSHEGSDHAYCHWTQAQHNVSFITMRRLFGYSIDWTFNYCMRHRQVGQAQA